MYVRNSTSIKFHVKWLTYFNIPFDIVIALMLCMCVCVFSLFLRNIFTILPRHITLYQHLNQTKNTKHWNNAKKQTHPTATTSWVDTSGCTQKSKISNIRVNDMAKYLHSYGR